MTNYRYKDPEKEYDSEYESDGGGRYRPVCELGKGSYAKARLFKIPDSSKSVVVLEPVTGNNLELHEVRQKYFFFKTLYPEKKPQIFLDEQKAYRLIVPEVPGCSYKATPILSEEKLIELYIAAVDALSDCHQKNLFLIDLKEDNIHYDQAYKKAYLIDGGTSAQPHVAFNLVKNWVKLFEVRHMPDELKNTLQKKIISHLQEKSPQIAPECWSIRDCYANASMDIFSLGSMMARLGHSLALSDELKMIIHCCQNEDPSQRPALASLRKQLVEVLQKKNAFNCKSF